MERAKEQLPPMDATFLLQRAAADDEFSGHEPSLYFPDCAGFLAYLRQG